MPVAWVSVTRRLEFLAPWPVFTCLLPGCPLLAVGKRLGARCLGARGLHARYLIACCLSAGVPGALPSGLVRSCPLLSCPLPCPFSVLSLVLSCAQSCPCVHAWINISNAMVTYGPRRSATALRSQQCPTASYGCSLPECSDKLFLFSRLEVFRVHLQQCHNAVACF